MDPGKIIKEFRLKRGLTQHNLAELLDVSPSVISYIEKGKRNPSAKLLKRIREKFGIRILIDYTSIDQPSKEEAHKTDFQGSSAPTEAFPPYYASYNYMGTDFVLIPIARNHLSPSGEIELTGEGKVQLAFRRDWLRRAGDLNPESLILLKVPDNTMDPTLLEGDMVLVDQSKKTVEIDSLYALKFENRILVRRLQIDPASGEIIIIADNEKYHPLRINKEKLQVLGKLIWLGREIWKPSII